MSVGAINLEGIQTKSTQNINADIKQRGSYCQQSMNELKYDAVTFGSKEKSEDKNIKKYLLWAGAAVLAVAGGFLCKPLFQKISTLRRLAKNEGALNFIENAKKQKAEIINDTVRSIDGTLVRVVTKKMPSGTKVTQVHPDGFVKNPYVRIVENSKGKSITAYGGDKTSAMSLTIHPDGSGKVRGYCAFADKSGEYIQIRPEKDGCSIIRKASKPNEALPIDLSGVNEKDKLIQKINGEDFEYLTLPEVKGKIVNLKQVNEAEIGYPFGPNPFDIAKA